MQVQSLSAQGKQVYVYDFTSFTTHKRAHVHFFFFPLSSFLTYNIISFQKSNTHTLTVRGAGAGARAHLPRRRCQHLDRRGSSLIPHAGFRGLYKGYGATMVRARTVLHRRRPVHVQMSFGPYSAFYLSFFELFKTVNVGQYPATDSSSRSTALRWNMLNGASAGALASWLTSPLDLVKMRMQVDRGPAAFGYNYSGVATGVYQIWKDGGPRALWRGSTVRMAYQAPQAALTMSSFEWMKTRLQAES
jgi:hypothetical protein